MNYSRLRYLLIPSLISIGLPTVVAQALQEGAASIMGMVQDPNGNGFGGASVILESAAGGVREETKSDERGGFRLSGLRAGTYMVSIQTRGIGGAKFKADIVAGELRSLPPLRFYLLPAGGCFFAWDAELDRSRFPPGGPSVGGLAGTVRSGLGPIVGARVMLKCWVSLQCKEDPRSTKTDSRGDFAFENVQPGRYYLSIEQDNFFALRNMGFEVPGGLESFYSFELTPCPGGDCTVAPDRSSVKPIVCD